MRQDNSLRSILLVLLIAGVISSFTAQVVVAIVGIPPGSGGSDPGTPRPESLVSIGTPLRGFRSPPTGPVPSWTVAREPGRPLAVGSTYWPRQRGYRLANPSAERGRFAASGAGSWPVDQYSWRQANPFAAAPVVSSPQVPTRFFPKAGGRFPLSAVASGHGPAFGRASPWGEQVAYESPWPATTPGLPRPGLPRPGDRTNAAVWQYPATLQDGR